MIWIYHHNDLDGRCAAAIADLAYIHDANCKFIEMNYNKPTPIPTKEDEVPVAYIVDFSLQPKDMEALRKIVPRIVWIDHHKSAKDYPYQDLPGNRDFSEKGPAGCELAWKYFNRSAAVPRAVTLIGDYDSWRHNEKDCVPFFEGMKMENDAPESEIWTELLKEESSDLVKKITDNGRIAVKYRDNYTAEIRKAYGYETTFEGHRARVINAAGFGSAVLGPGALKDFDIGLTYIHDGVKYTCSIYSEKAGIDCAVIAKKHGGGGHKGAAGFTCEKLPWTHGV